MKPLKQTFLHDLAFDAMTGIIRSITNYESHVTGYKSPERGIVVNNHTSPADAALIIDGLDRRIYFLSNPYMKCFGSIGREMTKTPGKVTHTNIRNMIAMSKRGWLLGIMPEGKISQEGEINLPKRGAFLLSEKTNLPLIPVAIHGAREIWGWSDGDRTSAKIARKGGYYLNVGEPYMPSTDRITQRKELHEKLTSLYEEIKNKPL